MAPSFIVGIAAETVSQYRTLAKGAIRELVFKVEVLVNRSFLQNVYLTFAIICWFGNFCMVGKKKREPLIGHSDRPLIPIHFFSVFAPVITEDACFP
jgi:hypothetical protein